MNDQIAEVKARVDIASIIGERIELKKAGRNYKANCPFHGEKTPSFMVSPELQIFKCFGCGEAGDVFSFLEKFEGMEFPEALNYLASRVGIKLTKLNLGESNEREELLEINRQSLKFYHYILLNHPVGKKALEYLLKNRGLTKQTIEEFQLGYSPENSYILNKFLITRKKFSVKDVEKVGIGLPQGPNFYDRFNGRVIFPLFDHRGNPVGFSGRVLPWDKRDTGKYINSPETVLYHKSAVLYGLNLTRPFIKKKKVAIVVEGELDMISSYQVGIKNVVAIKGSALTEDQVKLLSHFAPEFILALDSDFAGDAAARRGIKVAENLGVDIKVATISKFKDPDEAARNDVDSYKSDLIAASKSDGVWSFMISSVISRYDKNTGSGITKILREVVPILADIQTGTRDHYVSLVAELLSLPRKEAIYELVDNYVKDRSEDKLEAVVTAVKEDEINKRREILEQRFLTMAFQFDPGLVSSDEVSSLISTPVSLKILDEYRRFMANHNKFDITLFAKNLPKELFDGFTKIFLVEDKFLPENPDDIKKELDLVLKELKIQKVKEDLKNLAAEMRNLEASGEKDKLLKAQNKFNKLAKALSGYKEGEGGGIIFEEG